MTVPPPRQTDRRQDQPQRSIQRRIVLWTLSLVIAVAFCSTLWLGSIARQALQDSHIRTCELLGQTLASSLAGRVSDGWTEENDRIVDGLAQDPRVAFIAVSDSDSRTIFQRTMDAQAYAGFAEVALAYDGKYIEPTRPIELTDGSQVVARKVPIWNPPARADGSSELATVRQHEGFVILAMRERNIAAVFTQMQMAQMLAAALICLFAVPVVIWAVRRWIAPLIALVHATGELARGEQPTFITHHSHDELGLLADRFNGMAQHLIAARTQLVDANAQLENKVEQRTDELAKVNKRLELEMIDKDEFIRAVSHDLGAPVRNITGMANLLLRKHAEEMTDEGLRKLERITANAKQQSALIQDLLDLSHIRTRPGNKEPVETEALVRELSESLSFDLEQKEINLQIISPLPVVVAEHNRLRQVFQNLLDNAIKYMRPDGEKRITVRAEQTDTDVTFYIEDTGIGIAQRDMNMVFQVFRRATDSKVHEIPGRGVGLANVKSIIQTHHGDIHVESTPGQGSTFIFTLPKTN